MYSMYYMYFRDFMYVVCQRFPLVALYELANVVHLSINNHKSKQSGNLNFLKLWDWHGFLDTTQLLCNIRLSCQLPNKTTKANREG